MTQMQRLDQRDQRDEGVATSRPRVLVVDDDPRVRQTIQWALEDEGFVVTTAADGRQALHQAAAHPPDLVVLDITLPILDGYQVARALRQSYGEHLPILAVTADGQARLKAERAGAYAYVRKPFDVVDLLDAIHRGLQRSGNYRQSDNVLESSAPSTRSADG